MTLGSRRKAPDSLDAWDLVMRALRHFWRMSREDNLLAQGLLAAGDERGAEDAYRCAQETLASFSAQLSEERRAHFLSTPTATLALARTL